MNRKLINEPQAIELYPPVSVPIGVDGMEITATIFAIIDHPINHQFMIRFPDGFEDIFTLAEDGTVESAKSTGQKYAQAIREDLQMIYFLTPDTALWHIRYPIDGALVNVWVRETMRDDQLSYDVFYKGDYRFSISIENFSWVSRTHRKIDPQPVNEDLAKEVIKLLDNESRLTNLNSV